LTEVSVVGGRVWAVGRHTGFRFTLDPLSQRVFRCGRCGYQADRDHNAAVNLAVWGEQQHTQTRDPEVRGPDTNASPRSQL
jgi:transposase